MPSEVQEFYLIKALFYCILSTNINFKLLQLTKPYVSFVCNLQCGSTPLHHAASRARMDVRVAALLVSKGANLNAIDHVLSVFYSTTTDCTNISYTASIVFLYGCPLYVIYILCSFNFSVLLLQNGRTPLHYAAQFNAANVAAFLIKKGAKVDAV